MKKILLAMVILITPYALWAQGWPEKYGGVMLQGFYWDSFKDTKWTNIESQADELSKYFDLIWVPQSGWCNGNKQMGYAPVWWFDHKSAFGTEAELRSMIATYKKKGVGIIEDVVINHRSGNTNWCDFPKETWNGHTMSWTLADICNGDDGGETRNNGYEVSGANDTGDDFKGSRDLDHTSANVQNNIKIYLDFLLNDLGYTGFRYDMVKGFSPYYVGMYNASSKPKFSVGEYWSGSYNNVTWWINGTKYDNAIQSAAFDFPLKDGINASFGSSTWDIKNKGMAGSTTGMNRYSVTFVDNHDTYDNNNNRLNNNVLAANAFILALPGTPCIFLPHWQKYKSEIGKMILARKAAGVTNQSEIVQQKPLNGGYVTVVRGDKAEVMVLSGYPNNFDTSGFTMISSGTNYAYYVSSTLDVTDILNNGQPETIPGEVKIHVSSTSGTAPYLYAWDGNGTKHNGAWPGKQLTATSTSADGKTWYDWTSTVTPINIIFNDGNGKQTSNIEGVSGERFYIIDPSNVTEKKFGYFEAPAAAYIHPGCATPMDDMAYAYFEAPADWNNIYTYAWNNSEKPAGEWPGTKISQVGTAPNGNKVYRWTHTTSSPTQIIFNNGQEGTGKQTANLDFVNGGYYNVKGLLYTVSQPKVTISAVGYAAFSFAQAIDFTQTEGLTAYIIIDNNGEEARLQQIDMAPANTGVVLKGNQGEYVLHPTTEATADESANLLKATSLTGPIVTDGTFYVLANKSKGVGFYKLADGNKVKANKSYLVYTASQAKSFIGFANETTGIHNVNTVVKENKGIYTLSGVKMNSNGKLPKGVYIINGKKHIIK